MKSHELLEVSGSIADSDQFSKIDEGLNGDAGSLLNTEVHSPARVLNGDVFWINFVL